MPLASQSHLDEHLETLIPQSDHLPYKAARYALFSGGKRFRPQIVFAICGDDGLDAAASIEVLHTYSLIHDDLPCMDNDDLRRGKPTVHKAFDEPQALLAGDYLQMLAFQILCESKTYSSEQKIELITILSKATQDMIIGQSLDLQPTKKNQTEIIEMHLAKTGALMRASCLFGAVIIDQDRKTLATCGEALGLAYQFCDDLKDNDSLLPKSRTEQLAHHYLDQALRLANGYPKLQALITQIS